MNQKYRYKQNAPQSLLITITRILRAPKEWIWKAWSDPEIIKQWWGPAGYTSKNAETNFQIGGKYSFDMEAEDGKVIWSTGVYQEIIPNKKIIYTDQFCDKDGNLVLGSDLGMRGHWPKKLYVTVEFYEIENDQTKMVISHDGIPKEMHNKYIEGWNQTLDKFQETVERYGDEHLKPLSADNIEADNQLASL